MIRQYILFVMVFTAGLPPIGVLLSKFLDDWNFLQLIGRGPLGKMLLRRLFLGQGRQLPEASHRALAPVEWATYRSLPC